MTSPLRSRRRQRPLLVAAALACLAALLAVVGPAAAQSSGSDLQLRQVDTSDPGSSELQFLYTGDDSALADTTLTANGSDVTADAPSPLADSTRIAVALVFDVTSAMDSSGGLVSAKEGAQEWLEGRSAEEADNQLVAVYTTANGGQRIQDFTSDTERLVTAIEDIGPPASDEALDQTALWGAIEAAGGGLAEHGQYQPNIVVMTGSNDSAGGDRQAAFGEVAASGASTFVAQLLSDGYNPGPLESLVSQYGGLVRSTDTGTDVSGLVAGLGSAIDDDQYSMGFASPAEAGSVEDLSLRVGDHTATASVVVGSTVTGAASLNPSVVEGNGGVSALQGPLGLVLVIVVALLAVAAFAYAIFSLFVREDRLAAALRPYDDALSGPVDPDEDEDRVQTMATTAIVQRAVAITEQVAQDRGFLSKAESALERANLPLRAGEALFFYAAIVLVLTLLAMVLTRNIIVGLIVGLFAAITPAAIVNFLAGQRRRQFHELLPDTLTLLSSTLRAGYSLMQGVEAVSQEVAEPMGLELRRVVSESRLGRPLEDSLDGVADRMDSPDFAWAVMAIRIQREVGGNLSELLLTVAETMVARERLRRDVNSLTAEGRVSAYVLAALPPGLAAVMFAINREYVETLVTTGAGQAMLVAGIVSAIVGFVWMKKLIEIDI